MLNLNLHSMFDCFAVEVPKAEGTSSRGRLKNISFNTINELTPRLADVIFFLAENTNSFSSLYFTHYKLVKNILRIIIHILKNN